MNSNKTPTGRSGPARLIEILQTNHSEEACTDCLSGLEAYVMSQFDNSPHNDNTMAMRQHLDGCEACATAYALLYEAVLAEQEGTLPAPSHIPTPDLSFLKVDAPSYLEKLSQALSVKKDSLVLQLDQLLYNMLVETQRGQMALARSGHNGRYTNKLFQLSSDQLPGKTVPLTVAAFKDNEQNGVCLVEVNVEPPGRSWPELANLAVTLRTTAEHMTAVTDEWGTAVFPRVNIHGLGSMRLIVSF